MKYLLTSLAVFGMVLAPFAASVPSAHAVLMWANNVESASQGDRVDGSDVLLARSDPNNALGAPNDVFYSLGFADQDSGDGSLVVSFGTAFNGNVTITVDETTNSTYPEETAEVSVSEDGISFTPIGTATNNGGVGNGQTVLNVPEDMCVLYVKLVNTTDPQGFENTADGFDVDAVGADGETNECPPPPEEPEDGNDDNDVKVKNSNSAHVFNYVSSKADTGDNYAGGSEGGDGGNGGDIEQYGSGNDYEVEESTTGNGGAGGNGSDGGQITTGDAAASSSAFNAVNTNITRVDRCGCVDGDDNDVRVRNRNSAWVGNIVKSKADTGDNTAKGSEGGDGGNGGDIEQEGGYQNGDGEYEVDESDTGSGGRGGNAGFGGTIMTGDAASASVVENRINRNRTIIR